MHVLYVSANHMLCAIVNFFLWWNALLDSYHIHYNYAILGVDCRRQYNPLVVQ